MIRETAIEFGKCSSLIWNQRDKASLADFVSMDPEEPLPCCMSEMQINTTALDTVWPPVRVLLFFINELLDGIGDSTDASLQSISSKTNTRRRNHEYSNSTFTDAAPCQKEDDRISQQLPGMFAQRYAYCLGITEKASPAVFDAVAASVHPDAELPASLQHALISCPPYCSLSSWLPWQAQAQAKFGQFTWTVVLSMKEDLVLALQSFTIYIQVSVTPLQDCTPSVHIAESSVMRWSGWAILQLLTCLKKAFRCLSKEIDTDHSSTAVLACLSLIRVFLQDGCDALSDAAGHAICKAGVLFSVTPLRAFYV